MAGSIVRVAFKQGDDITDRVFRESLNTLAMQAGDACSWSFGFGLIGSYSPGTGFTLAVDQSKMPTVRRNSFLAKITSNSSTAHAWTEVVSTGAGTWADKTGGRSGTTSVNPAYEINGRKGLPANWRVIMWEVVDTAGTTRYEFDFAVHIFPVRVEKITGSAGTKTTPCAFLYDFWTLDGVQIGTSQALAVPRPNGKRIAQAGNTGYGLAFYDGSTAKLLDAYEIPDTGTGC